MRTSTAPMSIPNAREIVPPPLPPPKNLEDFRNGDGPDMGWQFANSEYGSSSWNRNVAGSLSVHPQSSLYGNYKRGDNTDDRPDFDRRGSSASTITSLVDVDVKRESLFHQDEGYASLSGTKIGSSKSVFFPILSHFSLQAP